MTDLHPDRYVQKALISTTSKLFGIYENKDILITHAWSHYSGQGQFTNTENPLCRNSFVVTFRVDEVEKTIGKTTMLQNYSYMGDVISCYLSILYGKRFDSHGLLESVGRFCLPQFQQYSSFSKPQIPQNNHSPRKDLEIPLNLVEISRIERLLLDESLNERFVHFLDTAGKFYLLALQSFESQPEIAYLNLVTAGEVLSNYFHYDKDDLLDEKTKELLAAIEVGLENGQKIANHFRGKLLQVKARFVRTICSLINDYFFSHSESSRDYCALKKEDFKNRVSAAYDLRSIYLHTGVSFGEYIGGWSTGGPEIQVGSYLVGDREFQEALDKAPTYYGLERIIRFCLLSFIHMHGFPIDSRLDSNWAEDGAIVEPSQSSES